MTPLKFQFTIEETNQILEALGQLPFAKVHELIGKIQQQASSQLGEEGSPNATPVSP